MFPQIKYFEEDSDESTLRGGGGVEIVSVGERGGDSARFEVKCKANIC